MAAAGVTDAQVRGEAATVRRRSLGSQLTMANVRYLCNRLDGEFLFQNAIHLLSVKAAQRGNAFSNGPGQPLVQGSWGVELEGAWENPAPSLF